MRALHIGAVALALAFLAASPARATDANTCGYVQGNGGWYSQTDHSGPYSLDGNCTPTLLSGGSGGGSSSPVGTANVASSQVTIGATATLLVAARSGRREVTIASLGSNNIYIGGSGVTTSTGMLLPTATSAPLVVHTAAAIYGIMATGSQGVSVLESY